MTHFAKLILTILLALPTPKSATKAEHNAWLHKVAPAIAQASHNNPSVAAYVIALGTYESHFSRRIQAGRCHKGECDGGKAHGMWQMHRDALPRKYSLDDITGTDAESLQAAADAAARRVRGRIKMCGAGIPLRVFGGYAMSCDYVPHKAAARVKLYKRVLRKLKE